MTSTYESPFEETEERYWGATRIALTVVVLLIIAMWAWIYLWAPRDNPDRLETRSFATRAESLCAPLAADIAAIPATTTDTTIAERADFVTTGTEFAAAMVEGLKAESAAVTDENDRRLLEFWFADWDAYLADREAYAARLRAAPADANRSDLAFTISERSSGGQYTRTIDGFASVNDMTSCSVPGDI
ncbi:MAG: hypothetical protein RIB98_02060 [Acidimicrobiales bacterium]